MVRFDLFLATLNNIILKIGAALFILFLGFIIGRFTAKLSQKILKELEIDRIVANTIRFKIPLADLISFIIQFFVYSGAILLSLNQFGVGIKFLYFISMMVLLALILIIVTTIKDLIPNLLAAKEIKNKYTQGDMLKVGKIQGTIVEVTPTDIKIVTQQHDFMSIPNSYIKRHKKI